MPVVADRYGLDTVVWRSDSLLREWLSDGWEEDLPLLRGFGMAPIKAEGEPVELRDEYTGNLMEEL